VDRLVQGVAPIRLAADVGGTFTDVVLDTGEKYFTSKIATTIETPETAILERVDVRGRILRPLDTASVSQLVTELQQNEIEVPLPEGELSADDSATIQSSYEFHYERLFGRSVPQRDIEFLSWSVVVSGPQQNSEEALVTPETQPPRQPRSEAPIVPS
jgi:N-methylhydantoinase A/oxoprolinase/acetone carboxylase beta subunit